MSRYLKNNIGFRRVSACQFMAFFNAKAFMLGEILDGPKSSIFSPTSREILLQYFSAAGSLLFDIERTLIQCHDGVVSPKAVEDGEKLVLAFVSRMHKIIDSNPADFDPAFAKVWLDISRATMQPLLDNAKPLLDGDIATAFAAVTNFTLTYLNYIMFVLHELTCLVAGEKPILYLSQIDVMVQAGNSFCLPSARLAAYSKSGMLSDNSELKVLREVDETYLRTDERKVMAFRTIIESIAVYNVNII